MEPDSGDRLLDNHHASLQATGTGQQASDPLAYIEDFNLEPLQLNSQVTPEAVQRLIQGI